LCIARRMEALDEIHDVWMLRLREHLALPLCHEVSFGASTCQRKQLRSKLGMLLRPSCVLRGRPFPVAPDARSAFHVSHTRSPWTVVAVLLAPRKPARILVRLLSSRHDGSALALVAAPVHFPTWSSSLSFSLQTWSYFCPVRTPFVHTFCCRENIPLSDLASVGSIPCADLDLGPFRQLRLLPVHGIVMTKSAAAGPCFVAP